MERTLTSLRNSLDGKIYVYCKDAETAQEFIADAEAEGYHYGKLRPSESPADNIIALHDDKQLAHVGAIGRMDFQSGGGHRIDYAKYKNGDTDYYYSK